MIVTSDGSNGTPLRVHPAADIFPEMSTAEYAELREDIRAYGQRDAITLHPDGSVLDGRHRLRACEELGIPPRVETWDGTPGEEAEWVRSKNLTRRHLDTSQRSLIAARWRIVDARVRAEARRGARTDLGAEVDGAGKSSEEAGERFGVSARSVDSAARVLEHGGAELVAAVEGGELPVSAAAELTRLPAEERARLAGLTGDELHALAKKAKRERGREALTSSESEEWYTPAAVVEIARRVLGEIDLDPASSAEANATVRASRYYTEADDGLAQPWKGRVWCNPPYGKTDEGESNQGRWSERLVREYAAGAVTAAVLLVNATPDRTWFRPFWEHAIAFLCSRVRFARPGTGEAKQPTHANVLVYFGEDVAGFIRAVGDAGRVVLPADHPHLSQAWPTKAAPRPSTRAAVDAPKAGPRAAATRPKPSLAERQTTALKAQATREANARKKRRK